MLCVFLCGAVTVYSENIDPYDANSQYAYGENIGWFNFEPNIPDQNIGATVTSGNLTGFIWAENIGWINLDPNDSDPNSGISNDGAGWLTGYAWGENVGWINFDPNVPNDANHYGVIIESDGNFDGWAWGENIGWINFRSTDLYGHNVKACKVNLDDLANFADDWLKTGAELPGNLDGTGRVDLADYSILAENWFDFCPDGWQLK